MILVAAIKWIASAILWLTTMILSTIGLYAGFLAVGLVALLLIGMAIRRIIRRTT